MARQLTPRQRAKRGQELAKLVREHVLAHGGTEGEYNLSLPTILGRLEISVVDDWIAQRFDDVALATEHFGGHDLARVHGLNSYSGKWNFGCGERAEPSVLFAYWSKEIKRLLPEKYWR